METTILISGSRYYTDYKVFSEYLEKIVNGKVSFVFGDATGVDFLAKKYCEEHKYSFTVFEAEWKKYGKGAGPIRNKKMIDEKKPDIGIFFLAKGSKGTLQCLNYAKGKIKSIYVYEIKD